MTRMLASAASVSEAELVRDAGADIIDLKDPTAGALGALDATTIRAVVAANAGRTTVSATTGDLLGPVAEIAAAVRQTASLGVDIVKVGMFAAPSQWQAIVDALQPVCAQGTQIVAVLLADRRWPKDAVAMFATAGFLGVMVDTAAKSRGSLRAYRTLAELDSFVAAARNGDLVSGLAGGLAAADIAPLLALAPDYLGFRGALCEGAKREKRLQRGAAERIRALIPRQHTVETAA